MRIDIYSKEDCPYCQFAKEYLEMNDRVYTTYTLDRDFNRDDVVKQFPTARSFPIVVIDNEYIGGFNELKQYFSNS